VDLAPLRHDPGEPVVEEARDSVLDGVDGVADAETAKSAILAGELAAADRTAKELEPSYRHDSGLVLRVTRGATTKHLLNRASVRFFAMPLTLEHGAAT
jgi:hypothetical protein